MFKEEKNMEITLVTGNWAKITQAKEFLEPHGIKVNNIKMDIYKWFLCFPPKNFNLFPSFIMHK